jgi:hypothetical protein
MRLLHPLCLLGLLALAVGCSDLPDQQSAYDDLAAIQPVIIIRDEGGEVTTVYSVEYMRRWELQRLADKALVIKRAEEMGLGNADTREFMAYAEHRMAHDEAFRQAMIEQGQRMDEGDMSASDLEFSGVDLQEDRLRVQQLRNTLRSYGLKYEDLVNTETPAEFQSSLSPQDAGQSQDAGIPAEFQSQTAVPSEFQPAPGEPAAAAAAPTAADFPEYPEFH